METWNGKVPLVDCMEYKYQNQNLSTNSILYVVLSFVIKGLFGLKKNIFVKNIFLKKVFMENKLISYLFSHV